MKTTRLFLAIIALIPLLMTACNEIKPSTGAIGTEIQSHRPKMTTGEVKGKRYALVMGNASYDVDPNISQLQNPLNDARDMRKALQDVGFKVVYLENAANRRQMKVAVQKFTDQLGSGDVGLFYYAGHAVQIKGKNYLIPTKVKLPTETEVEYETMSAQYVLDKMEDAGNGFNIIILDACRDNPLSKIRSLRGHAKGGLAEMRNPKGSIIAFATSPNKGAEDGDERNGTYTKHLLRAIKIPGLTVEQMFKKVRDAVWEETKGRQIPWENSSLRGEFCFYSCQSEAERAAEEEKKRLKRELARLKREQAKRDRQQQKEEDNKRQNPNSDALIQTQKEKKLAEKRAQEAERRAQEAEKRAQEAAATQQRLQQQQDTGTEMPFIFNP
jgi:uncharacterized caspase-like protein/predicted small secreted protein